MAKKRTIGDRIFRACAFVGMSIFAFTYLLLLLWMVFSSFRWAKDFSLRPFEFLDFSWESIAANYQEAFKGTEDVTFLEMIGNSLILVVGNLVVTTAIPCITGYILAKYNFKIRGFLINLTVVTMVIPTIGSMALSYRLLSNLQLINKFTGVFLLGAGGLGFASLMYRNYFGAIPWSYAESAFLDGAGNFTVFIRIMLPQAVPLLVSLGIMGFISTWNDYMTPYMYLNSKPTVAYGIELISKVNKNKSNKPVLFAAMTFAAAVVLAVFCCFSDTIMNNMSAGGLKD